MIRHEERASKEINEIKRQAKREKDIHVAELLRHKDRAFTEMEAELRVQVQTAIAERDMQVSEKLSLA